MTGVKNNSLTNQAYSKIKEMIVTSQLEPGEILNEADFQRTLGLGRTPIHEALLRLSFEKLVAIIPRKGIEICRISYHVVNDIFNARLIIEPAALQQTYGILDRKWLEEMRLEFSKINEEKLLCTREGIIQYHKYDTAFHAMLVSALGNRYLTDLVGNYLNQLMMIGIATTKKSDLAYRANEDHVAIIDSILDGNCEEACNELATHIRNSRTDVFNNYFVTVD